MNEKLGTRFHCYFSQSMEKSQRKRENIAAKWLSTCMVASSCSSSASLSHPPPPLTTAIHATCPNAALPVQLFSSLSPRTCSQVLLDIPHPPYICRHPTLASFTKLRPPLTPPHRPTTPLHRTNRSPSCRESLCQKV